MAATSGIIGTDIEGRPIRVGDRVAWGVKNRLRIGSVVELHHVWTGRGKKVDQRDDHYIRTTTTTESTPQGRGGVFLDKHLLVIKD